MWLFQENKTPGLVKWLSLNRNAGKCKPESIKQYEGGGAAKQNVVVCLF